MSRLRHSYTGYLRSLQMSRHQVFAFVEGIEVDQYFWGQICRRVCQARALSYRIRPVQELPDGHGGKKALIAFYRHARGKAKLVSSLGGKRTSLVFFLDKDVDDVRRSQCRSPHVIYTTYYDVQNHVFKHADFIRGLSSALSIDPIEIEEHQAFKGDWCGSAASRWKHWVVLCLLAAKNRIHGPNYGFLSQVNTPINGPVDVAVHAAAVEAARVELGLTKKQIDEKILALSRRVDRHLSNGTYDIVFKGKWYATILDADARDAFSGRKLQFNGLASRVDAAMAATMDFSQPWAEQFTRPLSALVDRI